MECPICLTALKLDGSTMETPCGHGFCKACITECIRKWNPTCPMDRLPLQMHDIKPFNIETTRMQTMVGCPDCPSWNGPVSTWYAHRLSTCKPWKCRTCRQTVRVADQRRHMDAHVDRWDLFVHSDTFYQELAYHAPRNTAMDFDEFHTKLIEWLFFNDKKETPPVLNAPLVRSCPKEVKLTYQDFVKAVVRGLANETNFMAVESDEAANRWMTFHMKSLDSTVSNWTCSPHVPIEWLRQAVSRLTGIGTCQVRFVYRGTALNDDSIIGDCRSTSNACPTLHLVLNIIGGKPVIVFRSPHPLDSIVCSLTLRDWTLSCSYPTPVSIADMPGTYEWRLKLDRDNFVTPLATNHRKYPSVFWEAVSTHKVLFTFKDVPSGWIVTVNQLSSLPAVLRNYLLDRGLDSVSCSDFLAYWLPLMRQEAMKASGCVTFAALPQSLLDHYAELRIDPQPVEVRRIFILWSCSASCCSVHRLEGMSLPQPPPPQPVGFNVIEWGACQI